MFRGLYPTFMEYHISSLFFELLVAISSSELDQPKSSPTLPSMNSTPVALLKPESTRVG